MITAELRAALALNLSPLAGIRQFLVYRLVPSDTRPGKTDKIPVNPATWRNADPTDPLTWLDCWTACDLVDRVGPPFGVGYCFTDQQKYFFIDIDECLLPDGTGWNETAIWLCKMFNGCYVEISQSGRGLHIIGEYEIPLRHVNKNKACGLELYSKDRFVALTGKGATGNASFKRI